MSGFLSRCKLCKALAVLGRSRVVPRWSFGRASQAHEHEEALLCDACEARLAASESYVASVGLHDDAPFTARDVLRPLPEISGGGFVLGDASVLDCDAIVRFGAAVIWRASVSQGFPDIHLGERCEDALGGYLLRDDARLPDRARMVIEVFATPRELRHDRIVALPSSESGGSFHVHRFALFGMAFHLACGAVVHPSFDALCFERTHRVLVSDATTLVPSLVHLVIPALGSAHTPGVLRPARGRIGLQPGPRVD
jgi:hypothetical protein